MAAADTAKLIASLELKDKFTPTIKKAMVGLNTIDKRIDRTSSKATQFGQHLGLGLRNAAKGIAVGAGLIATAVAGIGIKSLTIAGDFEAQLNTINTIARTSKAGIDTIGSAIRKVATDTGTSLEDLTGGYYDLLSAGIKTADAQNVLIASNKLAIGGLSTTGEAINLLTTAINTYGGDATKAAGYSDIFAKAIERGKVTAAELAGSFAQVGPIAAASGIEIAELGAAYARLTSAGVPAAEAATQVRSAIVALTKRTKDLESLEKATGKSYLSIAGKKGLVVALQQLRKDAKENGVPLIDLLGRVEGLNFTLATTGPNFRAYNADLKAMGDAAGTASEQMAERQKGLNFQLSRLKALAKDAGITIGSALLPKITPLVEKLNTFVSGNQAGIAAFGDSIASLFSDANIKEGASILEGMFQTAKEVAPAIAASARLTGQVLSEAVGLFNSLPTELKALAISGLAINKLTGGLVTNIAGGLISAVLKQLVSGVVNVNGAVVNVNGGVVPGKGVPDVVKAGALGAGAAAAGVGGVTLGVVGLGLLIDQLHDPDDLKKLAGRAQTATARGVPDANNKPLAALRGIQNQLRVGARLEDRNSLQVEQAVIRNARAVAAATRAAGARTTNAVKNIPPPRLTTIVPVSVKQFINGRLIEAATGRFTSTIVGSRGAVREFG